MLNLTWAVHNTDKAVRHPAKFTVTMEQDMLCLTKVLRHRE